MSYFPTEMPALEPNWEDREFWKACAERRLAFQACGRCNTVRHPPTPMCPKCQSTEIVWMDAPSTARIFTFTVAHHASHPAVAANLPYVIAVVEFPTLQGVRLVTNITDVAPATVRIGQVVQLWWDDIGDGMQVPRFRPVAG